ncbi:hypothetical protein CWE09_10855 [Aliidiomarina minuta]|uniref:Peptidase S8/S53 domain-containing protein n=1 Tax=Aliidiomarina minuta TaxID=880057 RepID=A0A432W4E7_9GAMM|nr:S8 family serine peptidase [Aliidiomarina minuta]RUO24365.1 hypothetical protein CWE09_10855 [Aliidiomarina minuta]
MIMQRGLTRLYLLSACLITPVSLAQQGPPERPPVPPLPVEKAMERRAEQAMRQLERLERQLPQAAERAEERVQANITEAMLRRANQLPEQVPSHVGTSLPATLDITSAQGASRFREIQLEPHIRIVQREWVLLASAADMENLRQSDSELLSYIHQSRELQSLQQHLVTFRVPDSLDNQQSIERLLPSHLHQALDRQHVYQLQEGASASPLFQYPMPAVCEENLRIGIIDTHLQTGHPGLSKAREQGRLTEFSALEGYDHLPTEHGTAVSGIFVGEYSDLNPLLPAAHVFQAGAFYQQQSAHRGSKVEYLLTSIDWLLSQDVAVINMSLAGPANNLLRQAVQVAADNNVAIVAAVGNPGPHAPAQYPAAYSSVIAVTAVDQSGQVYPWAIQGSHVDFAAPGVSMPTLMANGGLSLRSGTSMAAPVVSAFAGCFRQSGVNETKTYLQQLTRDLGEPGRDPIYGYGLLHP